MRTYQINAWVSGNGTISLPNMPDLYNKEVQLVITPKETEMKKTETKEAEKDERQPIPNFVELCRSLQDCRPSKEEEAAKKFSKKQLVSKFLSKWSGIIKDVPDLPDNEEERLADKLRYEYLKKKYDIDGSYISDEDVDNARYEYLMEKHK